MLFGWHVHLALLVVAPAEHLTLEELDRTGMVGSGRNISNTMHQYEWDDELSSRRVIDCVYVLLRVRLDILAPAG